VVLVVEHATLLEGRLTPVVGAMLAALAAAALLSGIGFLSADKRLKKAGA
jgi:hypothetical protein